MSSDRPQTIGLLQDQCGGKSLMLISSEGFLLKPYSEKEHSFYRWLNQQPSDTGRQNMRQIVPRYLGVTSICPLQIKMQSKSNWINHLIQSKYSAQEDKQKYLVLQNLLSQMKKPSVLDLKIGVKKWKASNVKFASSTSPTHHFRMCGMKVFQPKTQKIIFKDKFYHQSIGPNEIQVNLAHFFYDGQHLNIPRIQETIVQLRRIVQCLENIPGIKIQSMSLLIGYDGVDESCGVCLRLIDYDKWTWQDKQQTDQNRLKGLVNIGMFLERIINKQIYIQELIRNRTDL